MNYAKIVFYLSKAHIKIRGNYYEFWKFIISVYKKTV